HVLHDGVDVFGLFLLRIRVIEAQVGLAAKLVCQSEVQADGFGVSDMQVAVRLGRKTSLHPPAVLVGLQVFQNDVANEIRWTSLSRSVDPWGGGSVGRIHQDFILYWTVWRGHSCPLPLTLLCQWY